LPARPRLLVTSNRAAGDWGAVLGAPVVANAILDRLLHHSRVLTIRDDSYRLREKRRSGLLKVAPAAIEERGFRGRQRPGLQRRLTKLESHSCA
jgi:hypothetical protein